MVEKINGNGDSSSTIHIGRIERSFGAFGRFIDDSGPIVASATASIGLVFLLDIAKAGWTSSGWTSLLLLGLCVFIVLLQVYGTWGLNKRSLELSAVTKENKSLREALMNTAGDYKSHCDQKLFSIAIAMNFTGCDRVSLYKYEANQFTMIGRYAERPELNEPGRGIYPARQGVIGKAWSDRDGFAYADDLPDFDVDPEEYIRASAKRFGMPQEAVSQMLMKSRTFLAYVLKDEHGKGRAAVIVLESLEAGRFDVDAAKGLLAGNVGRELSQLLNIMKTQEPSVELAARKGF
jgi:hypothetical protein